MNINLATYIARDADGNADIEATRTKFNADLDNYVVGVETEQDTIRAAVDGVFADLNGTGANVDYIVSAALQKLNISAYPLMFKVMKERIHSFLTTNSQGKTDKESGLVERPASLYVVGRGKGARTQRRSDIKAPESK